ncbi:MAG: tRNA (adenosine(37)-N6)-threonylcarbamoyltransferase complex ATPase subunit type 1 TsaE [Alphaproteobacteria bacterium]|nr:tRNA (adenosine(37)-N6)-threonylcarbamoyltransferase complex ATPase subunit type 1 TsaE [Alphaproteobacteria bacterium]
MEEPVLTYYSRNEADTVSLAKGLKPLLKKGDIIALYGTLGVGKTAFTRALIQSEIPDEEVPSPTFTLVQTYALKEGEIFHFDLYRLEDPEEVYELGIEDAFSDGISLIEWPDKMGYILPHKKILKIEITLNGKERIFKLSSQNPVWMERLKALKY